MQKALLLANEPADKINILSDLALVSEKLDLPQDAIRYFKNVLALDSSFNTALLRFALVKLCFVEEAYADVALYAPPLVNISEYSKSALMLLANSAIIAKNSADARKYLSRMVAEIMTSSNFPFSQPDYVYILDGLHSLKGFDNEKKLLTFLQSKYKQQDWFKNIQLRLDDTNQVTAKRAPRLDKTKGKQSVLPKTKKHLTECISGNSAEIVHSIKTLKLALEEMGAKFHSDLGIIERKGDINIFCVNNTVQKVNLIELPIRAMPFLDDYKFELSSDCKLVVKARKKMLNPQQNQ